MYSHVYDNVPFVGPRLTICLIIWQIRVKCQPSPANFENFVAKVIFRIILKFGHHSDIAAWPEIFIKSLRNVKW